MLSYTYEKQDKKLYFPINLQDWKKGKCIETTGGKMIEASPAAGNNKITVTDPATDLILP